MWETISQFAIATFGAAAIILVAKKNKWGFVVGLLSQPFWFITALINKQWGVFVVSIICTGSWAFGVYGWFFKVAPQSSNERLRRSKENNIESKVKLGKHRHYKGKEYEVIGVGKDSETLNDVVIYRALYDSDKFGNNAVWTRPVEMFLGKVDVNGEEVPRFEYID